MKHFLFSLQTFFFFVSTNKETTFDYAMQSNAFVEEKKTQTTIPPEQLHTANQHLIINLLAFTLRENWLNPIQSWRIFFPPLHWLRTEG